MKNKKLLTTLGVTLFAGVAVLLTGCGSEPAHTHTYSSEWSHDATHHWHAATCEHSDEVADYEAHTFGADQYTVVGGTVYRVNYCTVCDYQSSETVDGAVGVSTEAELAAAIENDSTIYLGADIASSATLTTTKNITLNLNGHTLDVTVGPDYTSAIRVNGEGGANAALTLEDSVGTGRITSNGYGIYALNGGDVTVNGGSIESVYSAVSGNNTTGDVHFTINGGYLTSQCSPSIYMPGQVDLTITGGIINTGILLRMGQVTITGGEIYAYNPENVEDFATIEDNYTAQNATFGGAITVLAGTYNHSNATYGNSLNLNISGGTLMNEVSEDANQYARNVINIFVAGSVQQSININITGGTFASQNGSTIAITNLNSTITGSANNAYNNDGTGNVTNSATLVITGGNYSNDVANLLDTGYTTTESEGYWTVVPVEEEENSNGDE